MSPGDRNIFPERFGRRSMLSRVKSFLSTGQGLMVTATALVALGSGAIWLYRTVHSVTGAASFDEGTLVDNINTATQEQLQTVPGVGPTRAAQIIAGRPYAGIEELARISRISPAQVQNVRPFPTMSANTGER